jgi:hypothetical protein
MAILQTLPILREGCLLYPHQVFFQQIASSDDSLAIVITYLNEILQVPDTGNPIAIY